MRSTSPARLSHVSPFILTFGLQKETLCLPPWLEAGSVSLLCFLWPSALSAHSSSAWLELSSETKAIFGLRFCPCTECHPLGQPPGQLSSPGLLWLNLLLPQATARPGGSQLSGWRGRIPFFSISLQSYAFCCSVSFPFLLPCLSSGSYWNPYSWL